MGRHLWELAHGRDPRPVEPDRDPKSISHEETFDEDIADLEILLSELHALTDEVCLRLREKRWLATIATIKIRFADFPRSHASRLGRARSIKPGFFGIRYAPFGCLNREI